jgi:hypothetical protein
VTTVDAETLESHVAMLSLTRTEDHHPRVHGACWAKLVVEPLSIEATPCDPRTRQTLGMRMHEFFASYNSHTGNCIKNRGHRTAPLRKRGDTAKKASKQRAREDRANRRVLHASLQDQFDEVTEQQDDFEIDALAGHRPRRIQFVNRVPDFA